MALSEHPEEQEGFRRWIIVDEYDEEQLGQQIKFEELPEDVRHYVINMQYEKYNMD